MELLNYVIRFFNRPSLGMKVHDTNTSFKWMFFFEERYS